MAHLTFIHGIGNKSESEVLHQSWRRALAKDGGIDLGAEGVTSSMIYWADVMYAEPKPEADVHESAEEGAVDTDREDVDLAFRDAASAEEQEWLEKFAAKYRLDSELPPDEESSVGESGPEFERVPLPGWMKKRIMSAFLRDVHHYLWDAWHSPRPGEDFRVRTEIRRRVQQSLVDGAKSGAPHVIVSHSMGTVIAYDNLQRVAECPAVDGLITIGSPLGIDEIQDQLSPEWSRHDGFPVKTKSWINIYDRLDPVAGLDPLIMNDYQRRGSDAVVDINEQNWGTWRHSITKYLAGDQLREQLGSMLEL